jgi:exodeoxyribonuclease VII small subunit
MAEKLTFEKSMERLEEIVKLLEHGDVPLEKSLTLFEEGTFLIKNCSKALDRAEQKVSGLISKNDEDPEFEDLTLEE